MRFLLITAVMAAGLLAIPAVAQACSCLPPTEASVTAKADVAVGGTVLRTWRVGGLMTGRRYATIRVNRIYKGRVPRVIQVETRTNSAACGVNFEIGRSYRFGASARGRNYSTGLCSLF